MPSEQVADVTTQKVVDHLWMAAWSLPGLGLMVSGIAKNDAAMVLMGVPMLGLGAAASGMQRGMARWDNA